MSEPARQLDSLLVRPPEAAASSRCACGNHTLGESCCASCAARDTLALGAVDDPREHEADRFAEAYAAGGGHGAALPHAGPSTSAPLRIAPPPSLARSMDTPGHPLDADLRQDMEDRLGTPLGHVRVHHDGLAAQATRDLDAQAYSMGAHVAFGEGRYAPHRDEGRQLIAHELAHVAQDRGSTPVLRRKPNAGAAATPKKAGDKQEDSGPDWTRLQIHAAGMDDAAAFMATHQLNFRNEELRQRIYVGLHPKFLKVYDGTGKAIGGKLNFKKVPGLKFTPGIYVHVGAAMRAVTIDRSEQYIDVEPSSSTVVSRDLTAEERKQADEDAKKEGASAAPKALPIMDLTAILEDPGTFRQRATSVMNPLVIYFVPTYPSSGGSQNGAGGKGMYASPVEGRPDGQPPNAPPWPVSVSGPKLVPVDANPTYSATIDWGANGNYSVMSQAISQIGETIHYRWETFDITKYADEQAAKETAKARGEKVDESGLSYEARLERLQSSAVGSGKDVTGMGGANHEFKRAFGDWLDDTRRAARGVRNPQGDTTGERLSNMAANRLALEMTPASLLITTLGAIAGWVADLFAGPRQQQEVPLTKKGIYLVRAITTPAINEDPNGQPIIRPPSVASRITEVAPMETAVAEALDEPGAQLAELQAQIDQADKEGATSKAAYLRELLKQAQLRFEGSALDVLKNSRADKQKELDELHAKAPHLPDYDLTRDIGLIDDQIARYNRHEADRTEGATGLAPMQRLNATLISEVTGEQYPLLLSAGPMAMSGDQYRWLVSDVTNRDGDSYIGMGGTPSEALRSALTKFGGRAAYGRGRIGVRTGNLALEANADKTILVESAPANWALAEKRLDDLVMTLAAVGLFVASAGTASAVIGAAVAGARLIERWRAGRLYLDAQTVGDVLGVLGGVGMAGQLAAGLRVQKFEKIFAILQDGKFTQAQFDAVTKAINGAQKLARGVELANEVLNYGGLIWGNVTFIDQMVDIAAQERSGAMTHAAARRARAQAISSAVQNNGLFIAGNVMKAKQAQKEAAAQDKAAAAKRPPAAEPLPKADGTLHPGEVVGGEPLVAPERPLAEREQAKRTDAEEKAAPQADAAGPGAKPAAERRATVEELGRELPPEMQKLLKIDPALEGNDVRVEYTLDEHGLIQDIEIRCSADARPETVGQHADTVSAMRKYQGFSGRVRLAIADIGRLIGFDTIKPEHAASYQAMLEVQKLPKVIQAQLDYIATLEPKAAAEATAQLEHLQAQLDQHLRTLDLGTDFAGEGEGFVAAKGLSKAKQRQYAELEARLRQQEVGSDPHKAIRREMYELIGGDLPYESWERVYKANVMRARKANAIVAEEHARLGVGKPEQTIDVHDDGTTFRRLDIADKVRRIGYEVKAYESGNMYGTVEILDEARRDAQLVKREWKITWILIDTEPSGPLLDFLIQSNITVEWRTRIPGGGTRLTARILPSRP